MSENNEFYNFSQDLVIDLQNKPHKFIDLDSLINQLMEIKTKHGNAKVAIVTDRSLRFTYLYRVNKEGQVETDCLYPHKNETLGCAVHHVFIAADAEYLQDHELDRYLYDTSIYTNRSPFEYVSIECIGDDGVRYDVTIGENQIILCSQNRIDRDTNIKLIETFILSEDKKSDIHDVDDTSATSAYEWPSTLTSPPITHTDKPVVVFG